MPTDPASTQRPPDPMTEIGLKEHERRYLRRSLYVLCIVFGLLNVIGCRVLISPGVGMGNESLVRSGYSRYADYYWPSIPPKPWDWPSPEKSADFRGAPEFIRATYAMAYEDGVHYSMDVLGCGFPFNTYEIRTLRIIKRDGTIVLADPPVGAPARIRFSLVGWAINTLTFAGVFWLFIGMLPCAVMVLERRSEARQWRAKWLCPGCGYDVQDLRICPECGRNNDRPIRWVTE